MKDYCRRWCRGCKAWLSRREFSPGAEVCVECAARVAPVVVTYRRPCLRCDETMVTTERDVHVCRACKESLRTEAHRTPTSAQRDRLDELWERGDAHTRAYRGRLHERINARTEVRA